MAEEKAREPYTVCPLTYFHKLSSYSLRLHGAIRKRNGTAAVNHFRTRLYERSNAGNGKRAYVRRSTWRVVGTCADVLNAATDCLRNKVIAVGRGCP
jgi:hypothetical protein